MKRNILALLCALALLWAGLPGAAAASSSRDQRTADLLNTLGLVNGTGGSSGYALSSQATRAQAVTVFVRLAGCQQSAAQATVATGFTDLPAWAADAIRYAYGRGWVYGTSATTFSPNAPVSARAYVTFLLRMLGYCDADGDFHYADALDFARRIGLITEDYASGSFTRGDLFEITAAALCFPYHDGSGQTVIGRLVDQGAVSRAAANALGLLDDTLSPQQTWEQCSPAVFCLETYVEQIYADAKVPSGYASGFFISEDGLAATNYHAISGDIAANVILSTGETYPVERVVYYDEGRDLAVIQVSPVSLDGKRTSAFACLELANTSTLHNGDTVYAIGNPLGLGLTITSGIVSATERAVDGYTIPCVVNTAHISQGSSGGALLNDQGQVVAVTSGAYAYGNSMYLAVPVTPLLSADFSTRGWTLKELAAIETGAAARVKIPSAQ